MSNCSVTSGPFTVCAHACDSEITHIVESNMVFGFKNKIEWNSDNDNVTDLSQVYLTEDVSTVSYTNPPFANFSFDKTVGPCSSGWGTDEHVRRFTNSPWYDGAGQLCYQILYFSCRRCGENHGITFYWIDREIWQDWNWYFKTEITFGPGAPLSQIEQF